MQSFSNIDKIDIAITSGKSLTALFLTCALIYGAVGEVCRELDKQHQQLGSQAVQDQTPDIWQVFIEKQPKTAQEFNGPR